MANRRFNQFIYSFHGMPTQIDVDIPIGASGAVGTLSGAGITSVTRLVAGVYRVKFQDNYNRYLGSYVDVWSPNSGSDVASGSLTPGVVYVITAVGTTNWQTAGLPAGLTAAVGMVFKCAATASGTGTAKVQGVSGISAVEIIGSPQLELAPSGAANRGALVTLQTLAATNSSTTTLIPTDPANGSTLSCTFYLSNSSNAVQNNG